MTAGLLPASLVHAQNATDPNTTSSFNTEVGRRLEALKALPAAEGMGLLVPVVASDRTTEVPQALDPVTIRSRAVEIDQAYLRKLVSSIEFRLDATAPTINQAEVYTLNLFDDAPVRFVKESMRVDEQGFTIFHGTVIDDFNGDVSMAIKDGNVTATVRRLNKEYRLFLAPGGVHKVVEVMLSALPRGDDVVMPDVGPNSPGPKPPLPPSQPNPSREPRERASAGLITLTMLMAYTPQALAARPNITADIALMIDYLNRGLTDSKIDVQVQLLHSTLVDYQEPSNVTSYDVFSEAGLGIGDFGRVGQLRDTLDADLLGVLVGSVNDVCGLGTFNLPTVPERFLELARNTLSVASVGFSGACLPDTLAHEVGHNLGALHERYIQAGAQPGPAEYHFGYADTVGKFRDIMAYGRECSDKKFLCTNTNRFSNPDLSYNGRPIGVPFDQPLAADASRRMRELASMVDQFGPLFSLSTDPVVKVTRPTGGKVGSLITSNGIEYPGNISCGTANTICRAQLPPNTQLKLIATPDSGYAFAAWSGACSGSNTICQLAVNSFTSIVAIFTRNAPQTFTVSKTGSGTITSDVSGISCGTACATSFGSGAVVTLTAVPDSGWTFTSWGGACSGAEQCKLTISAATSVSATFTQNSPVSFKITKSGNGFVSSALQYTPFTSLLSCGNQCSTSTGAGTKVSLYATPDPGWRLGSWEGVLCGIRYGVFDTIESCNAVTASDTNVVVNFVPLQTPQKLTLTMIGAGHIQSNIRGINCFKSEQCEQVFESGEKILLYGGADSNFRFLSWGGACAGQTTKLNDNFFTCTVTMDSAKTVTATFVPKDTPQSLNVVVSGNGTVASAPDGISCGATCRGDFVDSANVDLAATPAAGWSLSGWGGACSGAGSCRVTMDGDKTVFATFVEPISSRNFTEFGIATAGSFANNIANGSDGNLWFTQGGGNKVAKVTPAGAITDYSLPTAASGVFDIAAGADGNLWFTEQSVNKIGKITPAGVVSEFTIPPATGISGISPYGIAAGSDGNLWFTEQTTNSIGRVSTSGAFARFAVPTASSAPKRIAAGPDSNLWFTQASGNKIGRISTSGTITEYAIPTANSSPGAITKGPDGAMWFVEEAGRKVGRITTVGTITEFTVSASSNLTSSTITTGPDGNLWFTYGTSAKLGQITTAGKITEFVTPSFNGAPRGITTGPDGNLWYTDLSANKIGRLTLRGFRQGAVFSTAQASSKSFLRFANTGSTAGAVSVTLADERSGLALAQWTSPNIPVGASRQFYIEEIEAAGGTFAKPQYYAMTVRSHMDGAFQHVLWRPSDGTLTNLSTCDTGVSANPTQLINVHSSLLEAGYPSSVVVSNTGTSSSTVSLGIYDATTGTKLGTFTTVAIPAGGQLLLPMTDIEAGAKVSPGTSIYHYVIKAEGAFTGYLQQLVNNKSTGVMTDMTTSCSLTAPTVVPAPTTLRQGAAFSTAQASSRSFLRFNNTSTAPNTVTVTLADDKTGQTLTQWTSPSIAAGASRQFFIEELESAGGGFAKPQYYAITVRSKFDGAFQHVLWRPSDGTLTNLSTCDAGVGANTSQLINVHSTLLDSGYPSSIVISNTGAATANITLGVYDATTGTKLGTYPAPPILAGAQAVIPMTTIESGAGVSPGTTIYHYIIKAEGSFTGYLQHLVNNKSTGVITDMTTICAMKGS